jgi:hypothetical protein
LRVTAHDPKSTISPAAPCRNTFRFLFLESRVK